MMSEDDKKDRVISMAEFKRDALGEMSNDEAITKCLDMITNIPNKQNLITVVCTEEGYQFIVASFNPEEIVFACKLMSDMTTMGYLEYE